VRGVIAWLVVVSLAASGEARAAESKTLRIASKSFTESVILAEIATQLERAAGFEVEHRVGLGGSRLVWDALVSGSIDVYPEYTGTLVDELLPTSSTGLAEALAARGIGMTAPLGFNNTYAIGLLSARARALGVARLSDLRAHPELTLGFSNEFMSRRDGWPALQQRYGLPQTKVQGLDHDLAYRALGSGAIDATDLYTTDAEIRRYGLRPLADDLRFFKRYDAVLLYRLDLEARVGPGAIEALRRLEGRFDEAKMVALNARAKLDRVSHTEVAADFLHATFGVVTAPPQAGAARRILARVVEHLLLVGVSLLAAILLAIPLGIVAARRRRVGQVVLAMVGVVQTLPTLALLVFMIPLFGIGTLPAVVALFLYGLLPIVRNTHAGLAGIPSVLVESAEALGLPSGARLRLVELPLASPLILAGIKSAAVINVGTATLGALIGAGGLGQPIFTGIRLDDVSLILQGAIPASLLALAVQGLFELVERAVVPRGLRGRSTQ
jgi:osmoprotectant transport system permease protein